MFTRVLDSQYLRDAGKLCCLRGNGGGIRRAHYNGDLSAGDTPSAVDALGGAGVELRAIVLGDD